MERMSREIAFENGWDAYAQGTDREKNPHHECKDSQLGAAKFSRAMREDWWFGWDMASKGRPRDYWLAVDDREKLEGP